MDKRRRPLGVLDDDGPVEQELMNEALFLRRIDEPGGLEDKVDDVSRDDAQEHEDDDGHRGDRECRQREPPPKESPHRGASSNATPTSCREDATCRGRRWPRRLLSLAP